MTRDEIRCALRVIAAWKPNDGVTKSECVQFDRIVVMLNHLENKMAVIIETHLFDDIFNGLDHYQERLIAGSVAGAKRTGALGMRGRGATKGKGGGTT